MYYGGMGLKLHCFADFCHHHVSATSPHMHAYRYSLFGSGTKQSLWKIALCM